MSYRPMSPKRGGAWTKVVIFVSLYALLLESLIECVIVLYLYGNNYVDSKMAPSLIFALIASLSTVPLGVLHSFLAWQYNRVIGYESQKAMLRTLCTYVLRFTTIIWLGASVSGLVVISQQVYCLPDAATGSFWNVGVSCALHRAVVIVAVSSFLTVCLCFCSRELCECPYDVSLLGIYKQHARRDGSILSASTLRSEKSLKHDILCVCRRPDVTYGRTPYMTLGNSSDNSGYTPSIQQPTPIRPTSFPRFSPDSDAATEYLSGTTATPTTHSDLCPSTVFRTASAATAQTVQSHQALPELPSGSNVQQQSNHKRDKSSVSLRQFLPKSFPSLLLSADPQIRALADANAQLDLENQAIAKEEPAPETLPETLEPSAPPSKLPQPPPKDNHFQPIQHSTTTTLAETPPVKPTLPRSITTNSADAPEPVILPPAPLAIRRSETSVSHTLPPQSNFYHHPNPIPTPWSTLLSPTQPRPLRISTMRTPRRHNQLEPLQSHPQTPRYTQSQRYPGNRNRASRHIRRNDIEGSGSGYGHGQGQVQGFNSGSGLRRPRSTTLSGRSIVSVPGHLDCIRESGTSFDEVPTGAGVDMDRRVGSS
ncbi:hypothetical protein BJX99DRAFT_268100 [Aspergillus californicus]